VFLDFQLLHDSLGDEKQIIVCRETLRESMLTLYTEQPDLPLHRIRVTFVGEEGVDQGGLTSSIQHFGLIHFKNISLAMKL